LKELSRRQAVEISHNGFEADVQTLIRGVSRRKIMPNWPFLLRVFVALAAIAAVWATAHIGIHLDATPSTPSQTDQQTRRLAPAQKAALISALSPFPNQKVELWCLVGVFDCGEFAEDFLDVFRQARWVAPRIEYGTADYDVVGVEPLVNDSLIPAYPVA
jgi:hypothetical protein